MTAEIPLSEQELTIAEIDEALGYLRDKVEDRYGNRLKHQQKVIYWEQIDSLLDLRLEMAEGNGNKKSSDRIVSF